MYEKIGGAVKRQYLVLVKVFKLFYTKCLSDSYHQALKQYNSTTEDRKKHFEELKAKDMKSAQEIELQMRKLQKIHVSKLINLKQLSNHA